MFIESFISRRKAYGNNDNNNNYDTNYVLLLLYVLLVFVAMIRVSSSRFRLESNIISINTVHRNYRRSRSNTVASALYNGLIT